jgi:hypothetical protein
MYVIDRRQVAQHIFMLLNSLRKTGMILQVSHSTVWRWLKNPERRLYPDKKATKQSITEAVKLAVKSDAFISSRKLNRLVLDTFQIQVTSKLVRVITKQGLTEKEVRFHGRTTYIESRTLAFSLKDTSFSRRERSLLQ